MNFTLMEQIIRHVFANLVVVPNQLVDVDKTLSLRDPQFLLPETLAFEDADKKQIKNSVWGCRIAANQSMEGITILLGDCTQYADIPEFCVITQLNDAPAYGLYVVYNDLHPECLPDPLIAVSVNHKDWMPCDTFLQATFLAGMEQIKNLNFGRTKCENYGTQFELMQSFIRFYSLFYGDA